MLFQKVASNNFKIRIEKESLLLSLQLIRSIDILRHVEIDIKRRRPQFFSRIDSQSLRLWEKKRKKQEKPKQRWESLKRGRMVDRERRQFSTTGTYNEVTGGERKSCDKESMDHRCLTAKPRSLVDRSWKLIDRGLPVRRRGKAVHDGDGDTEWRMESMKRPEGKGEAGVRNSAFRRREKKERGRAARRCGKVFHVDKRPGENWWKSVFHDRKIWEKL